MKTKVEVIVTYEVEHEDSTGLLGAVRDICKYGNAGVITSGYRYDRLEGAEFLRDAPA